MKLNKFNKLPVYAIFITLVFAATLFYYSVYRIRKTTLIYVNGSIVKNLNFPNTGVFWTPIWVENAISVNDRDFTPFGGINAEVIYKESLPDRSNGSMVNMVLKLNAIKDRSGQFLYKNKPLTVGSVINLTLPKANVNFMVTSIDVRMPKDNLNTIKVNALVKDLDLWQTEALKAGDLIKSSSGRNYIKIIKKQSDFARINAANEFGQKVGIVNREKVDMQVIMEITVSEKKDHYYFFDTQIIRPGTVLYVPWESGEMNMTITEILG